MHTWNLDNLYPSFTSEKYQKDVEILDELIEEFTLLTQNLNDGKPSKLLPQLLQTNIALLEKSRLLFAYISLVLATDTTHKEASLARVTMQNKMLALSLPSTLYTKYIVRLTNLDELIAQDPFLAEHSFYLKEVQKRGDHLLSDDEEVLISKLRRSGSNLWQQLYNDLTSTLEVDYNGESISLSQVRSLAYDKSSEVRKNAYKAELAAYKKIDKSIAFALNGIKTEVNTLAETRKFTSPLEQTLKNARLEENVLNALLAAIKEYLPHFHKYLRRKAEILGHKDGLPFYDLFAPVGTFQKEYTITEAQDFIIKHFGSFSDNLVNVAERAFDNNWIDYLPRLKKRGGAFCMSIHPIKESRILTNFTGSISDVITIAHELGHAYHNFNIFDESILNTSYSASIAETASVLCETIVKKAAIKEATSPEERLAILEQELQDSTQVIVDIYSRFLFETDVFKLSKDEFLNEDRLYELMAKAQKAAYLDGLDHNYLNPGMWINKGHYYSSGLSFYNFPYAFGLLFSKGIYAIYLERGASFTTKIDELLATTGKMAIADVAKSIDIDIENPEFWKKSLDMITEDINLFLELTKEDK